jgi:hypothetical protein
MTPCKFAISINDTSGTIVTTGVVDTGGKFASGVVYTNGAPILANISANFPKKILITLTLFLGACGKVIHGKKEAKNLVTPSLQRIGMI